jgi:hypothetical protein
MIQMKHWVLRRLKMGPEELALLVHRSSETVDQKHWEHHKYRKDYRHCRKNLRSEHHSCLMVWTALCNSVKKRHLQTFQSCQRPCLFVKKILQNMNRKKKARRNLEKALQELRNLLMVATDLNTPRHRSIQRECWEIRSLMKVLRELRNWLTEGPAVGGHHTFRTAPMVCLTMLVVPHSWKMVLQSFHLWDCYMSQMILRVIHKRKTVLMETRNSMQEQQEHRKKKLREQRNSKKELHHCLLFHYLELHN